MTIINDVHSDLTPITPEEISDYLDSDFSRSNFLADAISFDRSKGETNTTPREPSSLGVRGLIDAGNYWTQKASLSTSGRWFSAITSFTSDLVLLMAGDNGAANYGNMNDRFTLSSNTWESKANVTFTRAYSSGLSLTSDLCLLTAGFNSVLLGANERFSNTANSWTSRTAISPIRYGQSQAALTNDLGLIIAGYNGTANYANNDRYSNTANAWTSRTAYPQINRVGYSTAFDKVTVMYIAGYTTTYTNIAYRFNDTTNAWVARTSVSVAKYSGSSAAAQTTDCCLISGGAIPTSSGITASERFTDSSNTYTSKSDSTQGRAGNVQTSFTSSKSLNCTGRDSSAVKLSSVELYTDNCLPISTGFDLISNSINNSSSMPDSAGTQHVLTKTLLTTIPSKIVVGTLNKSASSVVPTVDVSGDGGNSWLITNKQLNTTIDTTLLTNRGFSDFRLRFNLSRAINANTWTVRNEVPFARTPSGGANLTSDIALLLGGYNGTYSRAADRFTESINTWTARSSWATSTRYLGCGFNLTSDLVLQGGGYNGPSSYRAETDRFSDSSNIWSSRTSFTFPRREAGCASLTSDLVIIAGGLNNAYLNSTQRHQDSANSWAARGNTSLARSDLSGGALTSDISVQAGGYNGGYLPTADRYSNSGNAWISRNSLPMNIGFVSGGSSLTSDSLLVSCGLIASGVYPSVSYRHSDSGNSWALRSSVSLVRLSTLAQLTNNTCLAMSGYNGGATYQGNTDRYNDGEYYFKGFGMKWA